MRKYILLISLLALTACTNEAPETTTVGETTTAIEDMSALSDDIEGDQSQEFVFNTKTIADEEADQSIFSDYDITMVNVWATYCGPCIVEMPFLEETYQEIKNMNCNLIGIVADTVTDTEDPYYVKNLETANQIVSDNGVTFTSLQTDIALYNYMTEELKLNAVPTTFFVDKDGNRVGSAVIGVHSKEEYVEYVKKALEEIGK